MRHAPSCQFVSQLAAIEPDALDFSRERAVSAHVSKDSGALNSLISRRGQRAGASAESVGLVVGLLYGGADPAPVGDLLAVGAGPLPDLGQLGLVGALAVVCPVPERRPPALRAALV
jgi:hypothetical protein